MSATSNPESNTKQKKVVVIGAGIGGLTTGALLAKAGFAVTILEAHVYPGGCAGTFYHQGYRFDAGATLAGGFYRGGPMDIVAKALEIDQWPVIEESEDMPAMTVHLPDGSSVDRLGGEERWDARQAAFGPQAEKFFRWQERSADLLWDLALRTPPWPPQSIRESGQLVNKGLEWLLANLGTVSRNLPALIRDALSHVNRHLSDQPNNLRLFIDAQLLIASQATSRGTNALYGASALDLPRRGIVHLRGGIGAIAQTIAEAFKEHGGELRFREEVLQICMKNGRPCAVETKRGRRYEADIVIANLPPWNIKKLLEAGNSRDDNSDHYTLPPKLRNLEESPSQGGGAFMVYAGVDDSVIRDGTSLHHQVILREPLGEGNTAFLSLSPAQDESRAPEGKRALTISTHTHIDPWWQLFHSDKSRYEQRKEHYTNMLLDAAQRVFPDLRDGISLVKPGTPVTFRRFTRREWGWVGGFPQSTLFEAWGPCLSPNLWMVGDTIFPGQSTAAVALGGMRVANTILSSANPTHAVKLSTDSKDNLKLADSVQTATSG